MTKRSEEPLVAVATVSGEAEAAILTGKLRSMGIWCATKKFGDMLSGGFTEGGGAGGFGFSYDIVVKTRDEKAARQALKV